MKNKILLLFCVFNGLLFAQTTEQLETSVNSTTVETQINDNSTSNQSDVTSTTQKTSSVAGSTSSSGVGAPTDYGDSGVANEVNSNFSLAGQIEIGSVSNSVLPISGKVNLSVPIATIKAGKELSFPVGISYSGEGVEKQANYDTELVQSGVLGIGWSLASIPNVVVDTKQTGTREDDTFYLNGEELIAIDHQHVNTFPGPKNYYEFKSKKFNNLNIKYYTSVNSSFFRQPLDYFEVIDENGIKYTYGNTLNSGDSREQIIKFGNWIGNAKSSNNSSLLTTVWNLKEIEDLWDNKISFLYEKVQNSLIEGLAVYTEASYIKEINSSNGNKIIFDYKDKSIFEYYKKHQQLGYTDKDAYQEKIEKKYLDNIKTYNTNNELVNKVDLKYSRYSTGKRFLTDVIKENNKGETLPKYSFEYNVTKGLDFYGHIDKVHYPKGGVIQYNYTNKTTISSTLNNYKTIVPSLSANYYYHSTMVKDNYVLMLYLSKETDSDGKADLKIRRFTWSGKNWDYDDYDFPYKIKDTSSERLENLNFVFGSDFYGISYKIVVSPFTNPKYYNYKLYLFHREENGKDWDEYVDHYLYYNDFSSNDDHSKGLFTGDDFVVLGSGKIEHEFPVYDWTGSSWRKTKLKKNHNCETYYAATSNYIIAFTGRTSNDVYDDTTSSQSDVYYFYYKDVTGEWVPKSWTSSIKSKFGLGAGTGYTAIHASNTSATFLLNGEPEIIVRWDEDYNVIDVKNIGGYNYDSWDFNYTGSNAFGFGWGYHRRPRDIFTFNGTSWIDKTDFNKTNNDRANTVIGDNSMFYKVIGNEGINYLTYNPNDESYNVGRMSTDYEWYQNGSDIMGIADGFMVSNNKYYKENRSNPSSVTYGGTFSSSLTNDFTYSNSSNYILVRLSEVIDHGGSAGSTLKESKLLYINQYDNTIDYHTFIDHEPMGTSYKLGVNSFLSNNTMFLKKRVNGNSNSFYTKLYRLIDNDYENIKNIVVDKVKINYDSKVREIEYSYYEPNPTINNSNTLYGKTIITDKGENNESKNGKTIKYFENGLNDIELTGLPIKTEVYNSQGAMIGKNELTWDHKYINCYNDLNTKVGEISYTRQKKITHTDFYNGESFIDEAIMSYDSYGQLKTTETTNSKGQKNRSEVYYAYEEDLTNKELLLELNMLNLPVKSINKVNGAYKSVKNVKLSTKTVGTKEIPYVDEVWSGKDLNSLRKDLDVIKVDDYGNTLETSNRSGLLTTIILGYNNQFPVVFIDNLTQSEIFTALGVSNWQIQNMNTTNLKNILKNLYTLFPKNSIKLNFYDNNGRIVEKIDIRQQSMYYYYDDFGRLDYTTDNNGKVIEKKIYNFVN